VVAEQRYEPYGEPRWVSGTLPTEFRYTGQRPDGNTVIIRPQPASFTEVLAGLHKHLWPEPDAWLEEERFSWE